jgi:hypothetical protein
VYDNAAGSTVYSPVPDPTVELTPPPGSDPQGNPAAEIAIDTIAHETVEAVTDPTGVGWMDPNGQEVGDKCQSGPQYGTPAGFATNGSPFNQVVGGREYLLQLMWSNAVLGCVASSTAAPAALPPEVDMTQFSPFVSGRIGVARGGLDVKLLLVRAGLPIAFASARTRSNGAWGPVELLGVADGAPRGLGDDRDALDIAYGKGGPTDETILTGNGGNPFTQSGWTGWYDLDSGFAVVSTGRGDVIAVGPCSQTGMLTLRVGGRQAVSPTTSCAGDSNVSVTSTPAIGPGTRISFSSADNRAVFPDNQTGALVRLSVTLGEPDSVSALANDQIPFPPTGLPACTADLENAHVGCSGLVPGARYSLQRVRRGARGVLHATAGGDGVAHFRAFSAIGGRRLKGGDLVVLRNSAGRTLTALHVAHLRVAVNGSQTVLARGTCDPGEYYGAPLSAPPTSTAAVELGPAGEGTVCPLGGDASGLPSSLIQQVDDRSGGLTLTRVPSISDTSPAMDATVPSTFVALAGASVPGANRSVIASRARVSLTVTAAGGGPTVVRVPNANSVRGTVVGPLAAGVYAAKWVLSDQNGDTRTLRTRFIVGG